MCVILIVILIPSPPIPKPDGSSDIYYYLYALWTRADADERRARFMRPNEHMRSLACSLARSFERALERTRKAMAPALERYVCALRTGKSDRLVYVFDQRKLVLKE